MEAKKIAIIAGVILLTFFIGKKVIKSGFKTFKGEEVTIERDIDSFSKVSVRTGIEATLIESDKEYIKIKTYKNSLDNLVTEVENDELTVEWSNMSFFEDRDAEVTIYYKNLESVSGSSGAEIIGEDTIYVDHFMASASSGGELDILVVHNTSNIQASSGGQIDLKGSGNYVEIKTSSGGEVNGEHFLHKTANIKTSSGGEIEIAVSDSIWGKVSSGGDIEIYADPTFVDIETSSGGSYEVH